MIPRTGLVADPLGALAAAGVLLDPVPDRAGGARRPVLLRAGGSAIATDAAGLVVAVRDLIDELERRVAADQHPVPRPRRHLHLVPPVDQSPAWTPRPGHLSGVSPSSAR